MNPGLNILSSSGGLSLMRILGTLSRTVGIVKQVSPIYKEIKPIIKKVPDLLSRMNLVRTNAYNLKSATSNYIQNDKNLVENSVTSGPNFFQ